MDSKILCQHSESISGITLLNISPPLNGAVAGLDVEVVVVLVDVVVVIGGAHVVDVVVSATVGAAVSGSGSGGTRSGICSHLLIHAAHGLLHLETPSRISALHSLGMLSH